MLPSLVIRQVFLLCDWLFVIAFVVAASFAVMNYLNPPQDKAPEAGGVSAVEPSESVGMLADVKPISAYDGIVASGMFGDAGSGASQVDKPPVPDDVAETQLNLKLLGTAATSPKDPFASAIIADEESKTIRTYGVGQAVSDNVTLEEVYPRQVILLNKQANRREVLRSEEDKNAAGVAMASSLPDGANSAPQPGGRITVSKNELITEVFANYSDIVQQIQPELYKDESGKVTGITASNIESIPLAKKLDIREGDVLQSVNGESIDSQEKILELVNKYRNANMVRIGILRNGKPVTVTYRLE